MVTKRLKKIANNSEPEKAEESDDLVSKKTGASLIATPQAQPLVVCVALLSDHQ